MAFTINKIGRILLAFMFASLIVSCSKEDDESPTPAVTEKLNIILDTDLGNSLDDVFALQTLFAYQASGECNVIGVMQSRKSEQAKRMADKLLHYYNGDNIPLGLVEGEEEFFPITPYCQLADSLGSDGQPLFEGTGIPLTDRLPAWKLYRKLLSQAQDNSISIVCIGMFTNLGLLLDSEGDEYSPLTGKELIRQKVKQLDVVGGCFTELPLRFKTTGDSAEFLKVEYNILGDIPLARHVIQDWPVQLNMLPVEEGLSYPSVHDDILEMYAWQPDSPVYQIYSRYDEWETGDLGAYMWDMVATLHTLLGEETFSCTTEGNISVDEDGRTTFVPTENGASHIICLNTTGSNTFWEIFSKISEYHP